MYTVEDVLKPEFRCSWQEAVAIVQEVASKTGGLPSVPPADALTLDEDGTVALGFASEIAENHVTSLARLLGRLLDGSGAPTQLEVMAQEDAGLHPRHASIAEFTAALEFFERPDRRSQLRTLAERIRAAQPSATEELERFRARLASEEAEVPLEDQPVPDVPPAPAETETELERLRKRISANASPLVEGRKLRGLSRALREANQPRIAFASAVFVLGAFGTFAGVYAFRSHTGAAATAAAPVAAAGSSPNAKGAAAGPVEAAPATDIMPPASEKRPITRALAVRDVPTPTNTHLQQTSLPVRATAPTVASRTASVTENLETPASEPVPRALESAVGRLGFPGVLDATDRPDHAAALAAPAFDAVSERAILRRAEMQQALLTGSDGSPFDVVSSRVYSMAESEVKPARLVRSQLPKEPAAGADTGYFEIVVDRAGDVELVKLISPARRYEDRMLVAAAKAWKFTPALLRGEPVRYRLRIPIILLDAP
jgi:hypothetical protein